jgi:hypothetical protein
MTSENPSENPSKLFHDNLLRKWKEDPSGFVADIDNHVDPYDRMGDGGNYVMNMIEGGEIKAEEFDQAAVGWLRTIKLSEIGEDFKDKSRYPLCMRMVDLLLVVMPNRKGETRFPEAVSWFRGNKERLLEVSITDDGGHWKNQLKRILRERFN